MRQALTLDPGKVPANLRNVDKATAGRHARTALRAGALIIANRAKELAPVRTGTLRRSITVFDGEGEEVSVGTNLEYAPFVEFGTRYMAPRPFLRPAFDEAGAEAMDEIADILDELIAGAV